MTARLGIALMPMVAIPATRQARERSGPCLLMKVPKDHKATKAFRVKLEAKA
jgi:hypothetical protein